MSQMDLQRADNESAFDYHKRLIHGKLTDKTLADCDYSELAELVYGQSYSSDVARRMMYGSRRTLELMDAERVNNITDASVLSDIDAQIIELRKERQKLYDQRNAFTRVVRDRSRQEELNEIIVQAVQGGELPRLDYQPHQIIHTDNDLLVSLNDIHYGANVNNAWNKYNSDICKSMMCKYVDRIITIGKIHQSENCICWMNGDAISGNIHYSISVTNKENVIEQVMGVSELVSEFLAELSNHFNHVYFVSVAGNHSRINPNKDNTLASERLDDLIEWYIKARLQNFENVHFECNKIDSTMYTINIRGKTYCGIHGDYDCSDSKVQALQTMIGFPVYAILSGHLHHNKVDAVQGIKTVMAGSFLGMDDYCVQKRIFGHPEQMVCVCNQDGIVCHYDIDLSN
jgi:hypothetical protein|nr:MAG TPA: DNA polymerase II small subunit [Bacteriophage sp.]